MVEYEPDADVQNAGDGVVDAGEVRSRGRWRRGAGAVASHRFSASLSIGLGMRWGTIAAVNLVSSAAVPTSSIYGTVRRGPPAIYWAGSPRSGRESRAQFTVGPTGGDQY